MCVTPRRIVRGGRESLLAAASAVAVGERGVQGCTSLRGRFSNSIPRCGAAHDACQASSAGRHRDTCGCKCRGPSSRARFSGRAVQPMTCGRAGRRAGGAALPARTAAAALEPAVVATLHSACALRRSRRRRGHTRRCLVAHQRGQRWLRALALRATNTAGTGTYDTGTAAGAAAAADAAG